MDDSVRVFIGGSGQWRELANWPPPGVSQQRWYLGPHGTLTPEPAARPGAPAVGFRYDPAYPTPSVGGAIMALSAGVRDNRALERRPTSPWPAGSGPPKLGPASHRRDVAAAARRPALSGGHLGAQ